MSTHDATFYVQLEAELYNLGSESVRDVRAVTLTQKRPGRQRPGSVLVKLTVRVPDAAFLPLRPEAVVVIPDSLAMLAPIEVEALDPEGD